MLIPDNIHPELTIYFNGSVVLKTLQDNPKIRLIDLYEKTEKERKMSISVFLLCLDWLFLINLINLKDNGMVEMCI